MICQENKFMRKITACFFVWSLAFSIGIAATFLVTGKTSHWFAPPASRSCQVKEVLKNGQVVWTPCDRFTG